MNEDYLHYVWKFQLFSNNNLKTIDNQTVSIVKQGNHNLNAGPDFTNAKIRIGNTLWAGNVEIHSKSSDWKRHNHQKDKAYNNVVLHVVHENDDEVMSENGNRIPEIALNDYLDQSLYQNYLSFINKNNWIACSNQLQDVDALKINNWLERLSIERLERKITDINGLLEKTNNDWEEVFYQFLCMNFGLKINQQPFLELAQKTPFKIFLKERNNELATEAVLLGQAGFLEKSSDEYSEKLKKEYQYLKVKYGLKPIHSQWKFAKLRPTSFPTVRIAQLAAMLNKHQNLFSQILESRQIKELHSLFEVEPSSYWINHYLPGKTSVKKKKKIGKTSIDIIMINTIIPFLFIYGKKKGNDVFCERALEYLTELKPEQNSIIKKWSEIGIDISNARQSQALIELKNEYCSQKKCLNCSIGVSLIKTE